MELCAKKLPPEEERRVRANAREYNEKFQYASNCIKTSKYNIVTFLPVNLFEQFQEVANTYFLFLLILQLIPQISSLSWFTTIVPLVLVLTITAVKDATDDYFRHKSDNQVNNRQSQVLINGRLQQEQWMNVRVGDIIKLENNQFVAADLLLLCSSEPHGLCYIETAELDGETNMKVRQAIPVTSQLGDIRKLARFDGEVVCEPPNNKLDKFSGTLYWKENKYPLSNQNMLLRGCVLRNSEWCFGLVVFAGPDTKLMQNSGRTKFKRTSIDRLMNTLVLWIFGFLVCMGVILAIGNGIWEYEVGACFQMYLPWDVAVDSAFFSGFLSFWSYIIILNTVVPISLYVSVEVIRLGHSYFINWDKKMYCAQRQTPAEARTTTLNEELGQVEYIFSDKTGTLTQNIMVFCKCSISGHSYGDVLDVLGHKAELGERTEPVDFSFNPLADPRFRFWDPSLLQAVRLGDPHVHEFFRLLSLCHTVMSEEKSEGELYYKAQSPDEGALVTAARNFGFVFRSRTPKTITVQELGRAVTYQLLAILDFNNVRKRMSVIVRSPEGRIRLYCKGADTILLERLHPAHPELLNVTTDHLNEYAGDGLRTLVLAYKDLEEGYYEGWAEQLLRASVAPEGREDRLARLYEEVEQDMMLLGATAIEDKLQQGVPETIALLTLANIKIWVLTGDKQETAVNIGYSCKMLTDDMTEVFLVTGHTVLEESPGEDAGLGARRGQRLLPRETPLVCPGLRAARRAGGRRGRVRPGHQRPQPGPRAGGRHGAGVPGDGLRLQGGDLLPGDPPAEGPGGGAGEEAQEGRDAGHRRRRQRRQHDQDRPHRRGHQRAGGYPGGAGLRLLLRPVPVPAAPPAGARALVLPAHVQVPLLLLLQELRLHHGPLLVRLLLRLLGPDGLRPVLHHALQHRLHLAAGARHGGV
ncbi:phospholipid-transporting ATPase ID isoform X4 [Pelodiscus sinensis]|uniref:phospholipid-transporting ATPase ID isoform X4 n=1 Tax=Pelodiscus sinensis TaxID=13735 RepID=UPI003F6D3268